MHSSFKIKFLQAAFKKMPNHTIKAFHNILEHPYNIKFHSSLLRLIFVMNVRFLETYQECF